MVYTSLFRVLCTITFMDVFNRIIKLKILFLIHLEQLSTTALANIALALHRICRLCKILKALLYETLKREMDDFL